MTANELKSQALRAARVPSFRRDEAEAAADRLLQPYKERDAKVKDNNRVTGSNVLPFNFRVEHVPWLANLLRLELQLP